MRGMRLVGIGGLGVVVAAGFLLSTTGQKVAYEDGERLATRAKISRTLRQQILSAAAENLPVLIETETHGYASIVEAIEREGGHVRHQYKYAKGLAAEIPVDSIETISSVRGVERIVADEIRSLNGGTTRTTNRGGVIPLGSDHELIERSLRRGDAIPLDTSSYRLETVDMAAVADAPSTYANPMTMNAASVWARGNLGQDSLAVVIDSGIYSDHFMLAPNVVGGVDISTDVGTTFEGFDNPNNHWHGTHVSGILGGHGAIIVPNDDLLVQSIEYYTGEALPAFDAANKLISLLGMAPDAKLYGIKVFPHTGAGAPESTIIAGIEHAIDLKLVDGEDVDLINMSLGGASLFDGRDLEDQTVDYATKVGITVVSAAGNEGPTSMTVSSPGSANTSITVGAVAHPINTRVFWDQNYGLFGVGDFLYVDENPQIVYFSSRGPTSDGRVKPTVSAVGVFVLSSFIDPSDPQLVAFASGTSMATPATAGTVALLNTYGENVDASPYDYKQALIRSAERLPGFDKLDQGAGFIDAHRALWKLKKDHRYGSKERPLSKHFSHRSHRPKGKPLWLHPHKGATIDIKDLAPGHSRHFYFRMDRFTEQVTIDVTNVDLGEDPILFNAFEVYLQSAIRTTGPGNGASYIDTTNVWGDAHMLVERLNTEVTGTVFGVVTEDLPLMPGYVRLVIENDWTSFDDLSGTFQVKLKKGHPYSKRGHGKFKKGHSEKPDLFEKGTLRTGESTVYDVGFGPAGVDIDLSWFRNWQSYPASDLDLIVQYEDSTGVHLNFDGATLNSPEVVRIESDDLKSVLVLVDGFDTNDRKEHYLLKVVHLE